MSEDRGMLMVHKVALGAGVAWGIAIAAVIADLLFGHQWRLGGVVTMTLAVAVVWTVIAAQCMSREKMADKVARKIALQAEADRLSRI